MKHVKIVVMRTTDHRSRRNKITKKHVILTRVEEWKVNTSNIEIGKAGSIQRHAKKHRVEDLDSIDVEFLHFEEVDPDSLPIEE